MHFRDNKQSSMEAVKTDTSDYLSLMKLEIEGNFSKLNENFSQKRGVLLDYPTHGNAGDYLIWLGELEFLKKYLNIKLRFSSNIENGPMAMLEKCVKREDIIFLQGGGNWGDLYPKHQLYREEIITRFKDNRIIVFPQTIYYQERENLVRSAQRINQHPRLTILVRDKMSEAIAREHYIAADIRLCPDMAFYLDIKFNKPQILNPKSLIIIRRDKELKKEVEYQVNFQEYEIADWPDMTTKSERSMVRIISYVCRRFVRVMQLSHKLNILQSVLILLYKWCNQLYLFKAHILKDGAVRKFKQYKSITTTRMHGHILATLMRIDNVLLPNLYHKNQAYYECWGERNVCSKFKG